MHDIGFVPRRTLPDMLFWRATRGNWESLQMLVVIVTLSCLLFMMRGWINFAGNSKPQQGFHNMHFLQILKWMKLVWDLGIPKPRKDG